MHTVARVALCSLFVAGVVCAADSAVGLPKESPFKLRGGNAAPAAAANETIEFAGVSSIGKKTDLIFYDKAAKKSHWIAKGETKEGIEVISYDEVREQAVVKVNGVSKTLALRKGAGPVGGARAAVNSPAGFNTPLPPALAAPVPAQIPIPNASGAPSASTTNAPAPSPAASNAPAAPATPAEIQARQETEARMLVSDLLEIGMAQRRAYEEAQKKAADGGTSQNAALPEPQAVQAQQSQPPR